MASDHEYIEYNPGRFKELLGTRVLSGIITSIDYGGDKADVNILVPDIGAINNIPIFYHCPGAEEVANGSSAFEVGSLVYVLNKNGSLFITGFVDGLRTCLPISCCFEDDFSVFNPSIWDISKDPGGSATIEDGKIRLFASDMSDTRVQHDFTEAELSCMGDDFGISFKLRMNKLSCGSTSFMAAGVQLRAGLNKCFTSIYLQTTYGASYHKVYVAPFNSYDIDPFEGEEKFIKLMVTKVGALYRGDLYIDGGLIAGNIGLGISVTSDKNIYLNSIYCSTEAYFDNLCIIET